MAQFRASALEFVGAASQLSTAVSSLAINGQSTVICGDDAFATTAGLPLVDGQNPFTHVVRGSGGTWTTDRSLRGIPECLRNTEDIDSACRQTSMRLLGLVLAVK